MEKRRILYVLSGLAAGGTEAFVMNVVSALDKSKYDITFVLALDDNGQTHQFREDESLALGVTIYRTCDLYNIKCWVRHYIKLLHILRTKGPFDVIHCNMDLFNGINLLAAKKAGIPIRICHSHNSESQYSTNFIKKAAARSYRIFMRQLIHKYATVKLGCSKVANAYLYGSNWEKDQTCHVLYNGIDLEKFKNIQSKKKDDKIHLMTVGRFDAQKNPVFLFEILKELVKLRNDFHFQWVGVGNEFEHIKEMIAKEKLENVIELLGKRRNVPELMADNQYFLLPSKFEGLGIVLIEAQATGLHCFASDRVPTEVDAGLCNYYPLTWSAEKWAEEINSYINCQEKKVIDENLLKTFDVQRTVKELEKYYQGKVCED